MGNLDLYSKALGAKVNWKKSYLLHVGDVPRIEIPEVREISPLCPYAHLGIPMGVDISEQLDEFWDSIL